MEIFLGVLLYIPYLIIKYYLTDHDTKAEKDLARFQGGVQLLHHKKFNEAFIYFDQQVKLHPKSAVALACRGKCNLQNENYYSALYDLSQALSFDNTLADCYLDKGKTHLYLKEFELAFREFDKAVWFFRNDNPEAFRLRGITRLRMHQFKQSKEDLQQAMNLGDEDSRYLLSQSPFSGNIPVE